MNDVHATDEFLTYLSVERNYSAHTVRAYADDLESFESFLRTHDRSLMLDDLRMSTCQRFIQDQVMNHRIQPRTIQRKISCLKSFNKFCLKENFTTVDFTSGIEAPKADEKLPVYMTLKELQQLFRSLEQDMRPLSLRNELMFKLLATSGMRRQELVETGFI